MKLFFIFLLFSFTPRLQHSGTPKVIMAIFAHPDDEAVTNVSALLARYAKEGYTAYLVIATKGEMGTDPRAGIPEGDSLAHVRAREALCACNALGIEPPILLGLGDGSLADDFTQEPVHVKIDSVLKKYRPDIIITWGPDGGYGHMDHRTVNTTVTDLYLSGELHKEAKLYYAGMPTRFWREWTEQKKGDIWIYNHWNAVPEEYLTTRIKVTEEDLDRAITALHCHWSQFSEDEMEETGRWMRSTNDTVYLRPLIPVSKISYELLP